MGNRLRQACGKAGLPEAAPASPGGPARASMAACLTLGALLLLPGCAGLKGFEPVAARERPTAQAGTMPPAARPGRPASAPGGSPHGATPGGPPTFVAVIKDARRIDGPLTAWQKDEKVWLELLPDQFGKPFLLLPKIKNGIGQGLLLGGLMTYPTAGAGGAQVVEFVRVYNTVRLQARNTDVTALDGTPESRAVQASYSASLLGATPVASQPHPDRKSVLIDVSSMFVNDLTGVGLQLQRTFRQGYSLDSRNSLITAVRGTPEALIIETQTHFFTGSVSTTPSPQSSFVPSVPRYLPDARSLLIGQHLSLLPLPDKPMAPRRADSRVGLFNTTVLDFSNDLARTPRQRMITRWRLDKKDPAAERSEPVKPITFWIDRNVPVPYRDTVRSAILEWNKAFERIGFSNAIVVKQQEDDARFDTLDPGYPSVRWLMSADPGFGAIGQTQIDPRTGEILSADIGFEAVVLRAQRYARSQVLGPSLPTPSSDPQGQARSFAAPWVLPQQVAAGLSGSGAHELCLHGEVAAEQMAYALDVMEARGDLDPGSPLAQQFVLDYIKDTVMHEIGHALGLRHNFRASRAYTEEQLSDPEFTRTHGTTGSVMEYNAINLSRPGQTGGTPFQTTIGPYDYWAVEYAYKPLLPGTTPAAEQAELQRIAGRNHEPLLAFGTDEDAYFGIDAETIQLDLGSDPVAFAAKRLDIARDLFRRQETRELPPERDYSVLRRSLGYALGDVTRAVGVLARQIGGLRTLRDHPGSGRDPLQPVPAAVQRQAFDLILRAVLSTDGFAVSPALQRRLAPDYLDRGEIPGLATDFNVPERLLDLQRNVLGYLLSDQMAGRLLDAQAKVDAGEDTLPLAEIYAAVSREVWSELDPGPSIGLSIPLSRRELQRDHVNRLAATLVRPTSQSRADARAALRQQAQTLLTRLDASLRRKGVDESTRLHLIDAADTLRQAFAARMPRLGV